jgi:uncharacterized protein
VNAVPVHVSIHDVSPRWTPQIEDALALCRDHGIRPALLVVPDFHGQAPLLDDPVFCQRLRDLQGAGHEVMLHGFSHQTSDRPSSGGARARLRWLFAQRILSSGEAELVDLPEREGRERIERGERLLSQAGLRIDGFVAPAWSMPTWLLPWLGARGYRFTEDHLRVYDPASGRARASVVLNWATRTPARLMSSVAYCRVARHARSMLPARIAIHPGDMRYLLVRREIDDLLAATKGDVVARASALL